MTAEKDLLNRYAESHNQGVRTGSYDALVDLFAEDASFSFAGFPVGAFRGRTEIARAFEESPPDDELVITDLEEHALEATAAYAWRSRPDEVEGTIHLREWNGRIVELRVIRGGRGGGGG